MRILFFTASAGNGHNSTTKRLKEKILEIDPKTEIEIIDVYKSYAGKLKAWTMEQGYFLACNHFVSIYNYFFKKSEKSNYLNRDKSKANKEVYPLLYGMLKKIYDFKPDIIISTYIFCSVALNNLRRYYSIPATTICMTLDYGISPYWECCTKGIDYMFLTDEYMVKPFIEKGFKKEQLIVSGIPVSDKFSNSLPKNEARKILNLKQNIFTLLIMKASFFPIKNKDIVKELSKIDTPIQVIIINGKNLKTQNNMQKYLNKFKLKHYIVNIGFTDKIVEYFSACDLILGKAGGLSTTESINSGIPSLIVNKLPQQEIYNKDYLIKNNCALEVNKNTIAKTINFLLKNKDEYEKLKESTLKIRKTNSLEKFMNVIFNCTPAIYNDVNYKLNKKEVIKNIDNSRKKSIKELKKTKKI